MRPKLVTLLKYAASFAILAYLIHGAWGDQSFSDLVNKPKNWIILSTAGLVCLVAVLVTFLRWHLLVRALDLPFTVRDSLRLGFLGYLFNFISLGSVGGDVFKAIFVAREQPGRRPEAVATVVIDRAIGLYALFLLGSMSILISGKLHAPQHEIRLICQGTLAATGVGTLSLLALLIPGTTGGRVSQWLSRLPKIGEVAIKLVDAVRIYRSKFWVIVVSILLSLLTHSAFTFCIYLIARGLPGNSPGLSDHFIIVPLSMVTGVLPLPLSGLGAFEGVIDFLYQHIAPAGLVVRGQGLIVAFVYRLITIAIAALGMVFYLTLRREMNAVLKNQPDFAATPSANGG